MTKKLYYIDSYISEFTSTVISVKSERDLYLVELDATAFFPEEGGQSADTGYIGEHLVVDVKETDEITLHVSDGRISAAVREIQKEERKHGKSRQKL